MEAKPEVRTSYVKRCESCGQQILEAFGTLTVGDAAHLLGVSMATIRNWADTGRLRSTRTVGGHRRFKEVHIAEFQRLMMAKANRREIVAGE